MITHRKTVNNFYHSIYSRQRQCSQNGQGFTVGLRVRFNLKKVYYIKKRLWNIYVNRMILRIRYYCIRLFRRKSDNCLESLITIFPCYNTIR